MKKNLKKIVTNESGAVMVEFGLALPFLVLSLMFLLLSYELVDSYFELQVNTYANLRIRSKLMEQGKFVVLQKLSDRQGKVVTVSGKLPEYFGMPVVPLHTTMSMYAGTMRGRGYSRYRIGAVRERNVQ